MKWRLYIRGGLHEDYLEFDTMEEATRLADKMKRRYPWYKIKVRRVKICG